MGVIQGKPAMFLCIDLDATKQTTWPDGTAVFCIDTGKMYKLATGVFTEFQAQAAAAWGGIAGTLANQIDLQAALDAAGGGAWGGITGTLALQLDLQAALDGKVAGNDARLSDARTPTAHDHTFASLTSKPTTIAGYGVTDAYTKAEVDSGLAGKQASLGFTAENAANKGGVSGYAGLDAGSKVAIANLPTGNGATQVCIGNDARLADARTPTAHNQDWSTITTGKPTTLAGYGITDAAAFLLARVAGSNATTTGQVLVNITGLSLALAINSVYKFEAILMVQASSTAGNKYGVNFSAAGAVVEAQISGTLAAATARSDRLNALNTATAVYVTAGAVGGIRIQGIVTVGANVGNLTIQHLKVTSGTSTVFINSWLEARKIA